MSEKQQQRVKALQALKDAVTGKMKRSDQVVIDDEAEIYETVSVEAYNKIVEERRKDNEFVVDDEGLGYYDDGEEHLFGDVDYAPKRLVNGPRKGHGALSLEAIERARRLDQIKKGPRQKVSSMFLGARGTVVGPKSTSGATGDDTMVGMDAFLNSALQSYDQKSEDHDVILQVQNQDESTLARKRQKKSAKSKQQLLARMLLDPKAMKDAEKHLDEQNKDSVINSAQLDGFPLTNFTNAESRALENFTGVSNEGIDHDIVNESEIQGNTISPSKRNASFMSQNGGTITNDASSQESAKSQLFKRRRMAAKLKRQQVEAIKLKQLAAQQLKIDSANRKKAEMQTKIAAKRAVAQARKADAAARRGVNSGASISDISERDTNSRMLSGSSISKGNSWEAIASKSNGVRATSTTPIGLGKLPTVTRKIKDLEGNIVERSVMDFFWLDIFESTNNPGNLYVFGKIKGQNGSFHSCCVLVPSVERHLFFLPREVQRDDPATNVSMESVWREVNNLFNKRFPQAESSFKSRTVQRQYAFELADVPTDKRDYLEVLYPATLPPFEKGLSGNTFSRVFGTHTSSLENFIIGRDIMGIFEVKSLV